MSIAMTNQPSPCEKQNVQRTQSLSQTRCRHPSSSSVHLPYHLQDHNHPRLRRRRPSTLSTHNYDMHSPVRRPPSRGQRNLCSPLNIQPYTGGHFLFPPALSPTMSSSPSTSPTPWFQTPKNSPRSFNHWPVPRPQTLSLHSASHSMDFLDSALPSPIRPMSHHQLSTRRSFDLLELQSPPTQHKPTHNQAKKRSCDMPDTPTNHIPTGNQTTEGSCDMLDLESTPTSSHNRKFDLLELSATPSSETFSHNDQNRKSFDILELSVTPLHQTPLKKLGARKSLDFNDIDCSIRQVSHRHGNISPYRGQLTSNSSHWYDRCSQGSLSTLSTLSHRAVVHPRVCTPHVGFDYLTPVRIRPPIHYQLRREWIDIIIT